MEDIQGNVLRGYGLPTAAYVNVRIGDPHEGRRLIADLGPVTDARRWRRGKPLSTVNIALSHAGLRALGVSEPTLRSFPPEFRQGMAARWCQLGDCGRSSPLGWESGLRAGDVQMLVVLHAQSRALLCNRLAWLRERVDARAAVSMDKPHCAEVLGNPDEPTREHFGYHDGFGQPAIAGVPGQYPGQGVSLRRRWPRGNRWRPLAAGEFVLGYRDDDGVMPAAPDAPFGRNGTFMVVRKLYQDVAAFRRLVRSLANRHFSGDGELAKAKLAGRWPDGTPTLFAHRPGSRPGKSTINDFRYAGDSDGYACPLGAHMRRANPRDALFNGSDRSRRHRIIRRGMPYGPPLCFDDVKDDGADRGLFFVCFNASIARQFETVNRWLLDGNPFGVAGEADALTAHSCGVMTVQGNPPRRLALEPLVWTRGGEYLFLPGLTALDALSDPKAVGSRG